MKFFLLLLALCLQAGSGAAPHDPTSPGLLGVNKPFTFDAKIGTYHVYPNGRIQDALEAAAADPVNKRVYVHAGTYRPAAKAQALIWFNARHDGITLEAVGDVILTAANPEIADRKASSYPAVVNHVVYLGDGISRKTVFRGFKVTGANNFTTGSGGEVADRVGRNQEASATRSTSKMAMVCAAPSSTATSTICGGRSRGS